MGCGQSKIHLYPKKSKSKTCGKKTGHDDSDADADDDDGKINDAKTDTFCEKEKHDDELESEESKLPGTDSELSVSLLRSKNLSLLQNQEISSSQQNFFQMLDKKIDEGPDYDSSSETEIALEEARLNALIQHWESASLTTSLCSSASRSLQSTPVHLLHAAQPTVMTQPTASQQQHQPQPMKDHLLPSSHEDSYRMQHAAAAAQPPAPPAGGSGDHHQQLLISQMNLQAMQQITGIPQQVPLSILATQKPLPLLNNPTGPVLQMPSHVVGQHENSHLMNMATAASAASPHAIKSLTNTKISPKHIADSRVFMSPPNQHQIQSPSQYVMGGPSTLLNSSRSPAAINIIPQSQLRMPMQMVYYDQPTHQRMQPSGMETAFQANKQQPAPCYGEMQVHTMQVESSPNTDYRFPPAISVQRLAPQVQRQLRETQELIKDSCPQLYGSGYGSPGPPVRSQTRNPPRRSTLETNFTQES